MAQHSSLPPPRGPDPRLTSDAESYCLFFNTRSATVNMYNTPIVHGFFRNAIQNSAAIANDNVASLQPTIASTVSRVVSYGQGYVRGKSSRPCT